MPTSTTPPAVYHIHGSAAGAFPGVAASASPDGKLKVKGLVEAEVATTDEILDAFDGEPTLQMLVLVLSLCLCGPAVVEYLICAGSPFPTRCYLCIHLR